MSKYSVVAWKEEGIWTAHSPSVPGCYGLGKTKRAAISDLSSAVKDMLAYMAEIGEERPAPRRIDLVTIEV